MNMKSATVLSRLKPQSPRARRAVLGAGFIALAVIASASIFATGPEPLPEEREEKAWPVSTLAIEPTRLRPSFSAHGRIEASHQARLRTDLNAQVLEVHVKAGEWVPEGALLISLDDRESRLALAQHQATVSELAAVIRSIELEAAQIEATTDHYASMQQIAQHKLERHQNLMSERLISQALLDEVTAQANQAQIQYRTHLRELQDFPNRLAAANAKLSRARALLADAELDVQKSRIVAPFSGPVLDVHVAAGDRSGLGSPLLEIADAASFELRVQIPNAYGDRFHDHLSRSSVVYADTDYGARLKLQRFASQVRRGQSGLDAFFEVPVESGAPATALGRMVAISVKLPEEDDVVALPVQSLYENNRVYAVQDQRLQSIPIERVGELRTEQGEYRVLVRSPELKPGQKIITTQLPRAISGLLVEPA
jgi:multidrug efflux pump subunit AcrA (membrane-fusion protein)